MRRGGGSRGSFGGGSRSFGGGSRSFGGGSRMMRSSRRHHSHRHHYGPRYYGPRYYGRSYYGPGYRNGGYYRSSGFGFLIGILIIFLLIAALIFSASLSSTEDYDIVLAPGTTYSIHHGFGDGNVVVTVNDGNAITYVFDNEPQISSTETISYQYSGSLTSSYEFYGISAPKDTVFTNSWTASSNIYYYAIRGDSNLESWENGNDAQFFSQYEDSDSHQFTAPESGTYYFALENTAFSVVTYDVTFQLTVPIHDLSDPLYEKSGSGTISSSDISGSSLIIYNPSSDQTATIDVVVQPQFSFGFIFGVFALIIFGAYFLFRSRSANRRYQNSEDLPQQGQSNDEPDSLLDAKHTETKYKTRPGPKFCQNCGSNILDNSKFCIECGHSISK